MKPKILFGSAVALLFLFLAFSQFKFYSDAWAVTFEVSDGQTSVDITSGKFKGNRLQILFPHAATPQALAPRTVATFLTSFLQPEDSLAGDPAFNATADSDALPSRSHARPEIPPTDRRPEP
jgi:hypothetical protein